MGTAMATKPIRNNGFTNCMFIYFRLQIYTFIINNTMFLFHLFINGSFRIHPLHNTS